MIAPSNPQGPASLDRDTVPAGDDGPANLAEALFRAARIHPANGIRHLAADGSSQLQTYPALLGEAARMLAGLRAAGVRRGSPVLFQFELNADFVPAFWACILGGMVPVPVSLSPTYEQPHSASAKLRNVWKLLDSPFVLSGDALAPRLRSFAAREGLDGFQVVTAAALRAHPAATEFTPGGPDDLAILVLTSGSTGLPKAVRQTHRRLTSWARSATAACEFTAADISLNWMPLDHIGGLVMSHLRDLIIGCTQLHATSEPVLRDPLVWLDWIHRYRVSVTWAPNFAYALVNDQVAGVAPGRWDLSCMVFILNGGEAIVSRTARRFLALLAPHGLAATTMRPAWGMSETCSGVTYSRRFTLALTSDDDAFVSVGEPIEGIELRIADPSDQPMPEGRTGRLQIRGISVTEGYHENPAANQAAFTADGWFITGDLGVVRDGQLAITGREKDVIISNGVNFYSHELEAVVEELNGVEISFTAACAIRPAGEDTDRIAIFFVPTPAAAGRLPEIAKAIRSAVARKEGVTPDFIVPLSRDDIPKTNIGKIQRAQLKERFEQGAYTSALARLLPAPGFFAPAWIPAPEDSASVTTSPPARLVLFADSTGLADGLATALKAEGSACIVVRSGAQFSSGPGGSWVMNPEDPAGYTRLVAALRAAAFTATHIVHTWAYPPALAEAAGADGLRNAQTRGAFSLLRLIQAWPALAESVAPLRLIVATSRLQALTAGDTPDIAHGPLTGLMRTLPHEFPGLQATLLDLPGVDHTADLAALRVEITLPAVDEVAVRGGRRHLRVLRRVEPPASASAGNLGFKVGGFYVVTGGLGGIGRVLAQALGRRYQVRLLLLGRTQLPSDQPADPRAVALQALAQAGAEVRHETGDLEDPAFITAAVDRAQKTWGRAPDGFLHLAGRYRDALLTNESVEAFWDVVRPKLVVGWALHTVARRYPGALFVNFSSVLANFGALGTGAYAAANAALEPLAHRQRQDGLIAGSLLWSRWTETGMARGFAAEEAMRVRGYLAIDPAAGADLLEAALRLDQPAVLIGLDAGNRLLRRHLAPDSLPEVESAGSPDYAGPRDATERALVGIWEQILGVPRVGIHDNFFELGGRSLLAARLFARIERELGRTLPLSTLFQAPTVATLAAILAADSSAPAPCLRAVQPRGDAPPLFCIPGGGSDPIVFQDLSIALGLNQPLYGLQARGLDATPVEGAFPSVEEVAAEFIRAIRGVQPAGPYHIGGHCFGCLVAWEVAVQLRAAGEEVGLLAMLDPIVSNVFSGEILGRDRLRYHFGKFLRLPLRGKLGYFAEKVRNFSRTLVVRQRIAQSYDMAHSMHARYQLKVCDLPVVVFLADDSFFKLVPARDPRLYYERLCPRGVKYHEVRGDHHAILHPPGIEGLAQALRTALAEARSTGLHAPPKSRP